MGHPTPGFVKQNRHKNLNDIKFCFLDTETTGLEKTARVHQFGAVILHDGAVFEAEAIELKFNFFADGPQPENMVKGYDYKELYDYPTFREQWAEVREFFVDTVLVAQNQGFDLRVMNHELEIIEKPLLEGPLIDLVWISKFMYPDDFKKSANLDVVAEHLGFSIYDEERHEALPDTILSAYCMGHMLYEYQEDGQKTLNDLLNDIGGKYE